MAEPLDRILIQLGIDTDKLHQDASKVESTVENLKSKIIGIGTTIAAALGITNFVNEAVSSFTELDKILRETQVISNGTSDVFGEMKKQLMDLAESSRFSTNELASSLKSIVDAGYEGQDAMKVLSESVRLATSTGDDLGSTVKALLDNLNMLGVSADSAGEYANKLFVTMNLGRDSVEETSRAITSLIPLAQQLGISYDEVASALGVLSNKGLDSTSAAMSLRNALVSVLTPTDQMKKLANDLGVELSVSALQSKGLADYLGELATATQGNTEAINTFFGGARNMTAVLALASDNAQDFKNALDTMREGTTALDNAFAVTSKSLDTQIQAMKNSIQNLAIAFGEAIQPMIKGLTDFISGFADWVREAPAWQKAIMGVGLALASLVPIIKGVSTAVAVMKGLFTGGMGLAQILTTAGVAVAGMTAIFGSLEYQTKKTNETLGKTSDAIKEVGGTAQTTSIDNVVSGFQQVNSTAQNTVKTVTDQMSALRRLIQLVTDYNYAQQTGLGDTQAIKKEIEDILAQYPTLNSAVLRTADGYALQVNNVKALVTGLTKTLEIEKQKLKTQLQQIDAQKKMAASYDDTKKQIDKIDAALKKAQEELKNIQLKQSKMNVETFYSTMTKEAGSTTYVPPAMPGLDMTKYVRQTIDELQKQRAELTNLLAEYEPYKLNLGTLSAQYTATETQIKEIDALIKSLNDSIKGITATVPTYEQTISNLEKQVKNFRTELSKAKTDTDKQAIGKIIDELYSQLIGLYEQSANNLATLGKTAEAITAGKTAQSYRDARTELQKQTEGISTTTTDVLKELRTTINAISTAIKAGNEEIAKRLYETAKSQYMDLLIKRYRGELEQSAIKELDGLKKSIDGYTTRFTTDETATLKQQIDTLTKKTVKEIEQNESVYEEALKSLLNQIQNGMVEAYIAGDTATFNLLKDYQTKLNTQWQNYLTQQANTMMKAIASMISQLQTIDISKGVLSEADLKTLEQVKKQFEGIDLSRAGKLGLTAEVDKLRESLQKISTVADVQGMLAGISTALESGSTELDTIKKQFDEIDKMMRDFEGVDVLKKKIEELGATIETALTKEDIEKAIQLYTDKVAMYSEKVANEQDAMLKEYYTKQLVGYLTNLENSYTKLMELTGEDYSKQIKDILDQLAKYQPSTVKVTDVEQLKKDIAQYETLVSKYKNDIAQATTDTMRTYYTGLLQNTLSSLVKSYESLGNLTGESFKEQIEGLLNEIESLKVKPVVESKEETTTTSDVEKAWQNVEKTLAEVENLQKLVVEVQGKEARDILNASLSSLNNVKNTLINIGKVEPTKDVTTKLLQINMLIDQINGKMQELNKMDFMASLTDFYEQFTALVQSGQLETALELLQATAKSAKDLGVALDFSKLEPAVFSQYGKVLEQMKTDMDGAKEKAKELLKTVSELATITGLESFQNLADALDLITKKTSQATDEVSGLGVELGKTATESEQAFQLILNLLGTYLTQVETYLAEGTDSAMENARVTMVMIENELKKLKDAGVKVPEAFQDAWNSAMNRLTSAENTYNAWIEEANQKRLEELEKQKQQLLEQARLYNGIKNELASMFTQFGEVGRLIQAILEEINFQVVQLEDGSYQLINPFEDLTSVIENVNKLLEDTNIRADVIVWSIQQIGNALTNIIEDFKAVFEPAPEKQTGQTLNYAKTLENWKNYDENVKKLKALQTQLALTETAATVSMGTIGALIGGLLGGPLGALLGGALGVLGGQAIGEATTEEVRKQIEELQAQLKVTFQELANALGTSIDSVATALERAFSADTYEEFLNNFSDSLEDMTKTALIRAFLASETMQPLLENLSNAITLAVLDGVLSPEELEVLKQLQSQLTETAKPFFEALMQLFPALPETAGAGTIERQTVGGIVRSSISEQTGGMLVGLMNSLNLVTQDIRDILKNGTVNVYVVNATDYARYTTESGR